jgi:hypothetical protein
MKTLREATLAAGGVGAGDVGVESARGGSQNKRPG